MGGSQAGAPADDDHVPWSRPPWRGHCDLIRPERPTGSGRDEAAGGSGGAEKICQRAATSTMLRLYINNLSNKNERTSKVYGTPGCKSKTETSPAGGSAVQAAVIERPCGRARANR
jgi:hypothetical protein